MVVRVERGFSCDWAKYIPPASPYPEAIAVQFGGLLFELNTRRVWWRGEVGAWDVVRAFQCLGIQRRRKSAGFKVTGVIQHSYITLLTFLLSSLSHHFRQS